MKRPHSIRKLKSGQRGFSLLEVGIGLAATAVVGLLLWGVLPRQHSQQTESQLQRQMDSVDAALLGFAQRQFRLPCPATDFQGRESCDGATVTGRLPWRDLGLSSDAAVLRYGVGSPTLLQAQASFIPNLPPAPLGYSVTGYSNITLVNGLDLCQTLRGQVAFAGGASIEGAQFVWAVAHPGSNGSFDGANVTGFDLPGKPHSVVPAYDDFVRAYSSAEMSSRLGCVQRLAQAQTSARAAYASYDMFELTEQFSRFRAYAYDVRKTNVSFAGANLALAIVDIANAVATQLTGAAITSSAGAGSASSAVATAKLLVPIGVAVAAAGAAGYSLASAIIAREKAGAQKEAAEKEVTAAGARYLLSYTKAVAADQKGLRP